MTQTLHIFRKDLHRGWPLLLLWGMLLAYWIAPIWNDPLHVEKLGGVDALPTIVVTLAGLVGAALAIQHDPLVGVREFWMTRPIRARSLLAAKALFVGAFLVVPPILLQFVTLLRYGLPRERWALQMLELSLPWAGLLAAACLLASWTRALPGFFALLAGLFVAPGFGFGVARLFRGANVSIGLASGFVPVLGLVVLGLLALQYATRRRFLGMAFGVVFISVSALGLFRFDPYSYLHRAVMPRLPDVHVELTPGSGRSTFAAERPGATAGRVLDLWFVPSPIAAPAGLALEISRVDGKIEWEDGRSTPFYATGEWYLSESPALQSSLEWAEGFGPESSWRALGVQGNAPFESLLGQTGTLRGKAAGSVWKLTEVKALPLQPGAEHGHGNSRVRIVEVGRPPGDLEIRLRSRELVDLRWSYPRMQLALANRARGETIPLLFRGEASQMLWGGLLVSPPFLLRAREGVWSPRSSWGLGEKEVDAEWLAGAELMLTYYDFAGAADIVVEAESLTVDSTESGSPSLYTFSRALVLAR